MSYEQVTINFKQHYTGQLRQQGSNTRHGKCGQSDLQRAWYSTYLPVVQVLATCNPGSTVMVVYLRQIYQFITQSWSTSYSQLRLADLTPPTMTPTVVQPIRPKSTIQASCGTPPTYPRYTCLPRCSSGSTVHTGSLSPLDLPVHYSQLEYTQLKVKLSSSNKVYQRRPQQYSSSDLSLLYRLAEVAGQPYQTRVTVVCPISEEHGIPSNYPKYKCNFVQRKFQMQVSMRESEFQIKRAPA